MEQNWYGGDFPRGGKNRSEKRKAIFGGRKSVGGAKVSKVVASTASKTNRAKVKQTKEKSTFRPRFSVEKDEELDDSRARQKKRRRHAEDSEEEFGEELEEDIPNLLQQNKSTRTDNQPDETSIEDCVKVDRYAIRPLTSTMLYKNMILMGCISQINDDNMIVCLPNSLLGTVHKNDVSTVYRKHCQTHDKNSVLHHLKDMYEVGMYVLCCIKSINETRKAEISLTLDPIKVNVGIVPANLTRYMLLAAAVVSKEDYGYIMDIGLGGPIGFLNFKQARRCINEGRRFFVGQVILCSSNMVEDECDIPHLQAIQLTADPLVLSNIQVDNVHYKPNDLYPGVQLILPIANNRMSLGLTLRGCDFKALVQTQHQESSFCHSKHYRTGNEVLGRILYLDPIFHVPYISLCSSLCKLSLSPLCKMKVGDIQTCKVICKDARKWIVSLRKKTIGMAKIADCPVNSFVVVGSKLSACIKHLWLMDGWVEVTLKVLEKENEDEEISVGDVIECEVLRATLKGLVVSFDGMKHRIMKNLIADESVKLKDTKKHYPVHSKILCRVLNISDNGKKFHLTCKPSLVKSDLPKLASYEEAVVGMEYMGYVSAVESNETEIKFYGNVKGILKRENVLNIRRSSLPLNMFCKGQSLVCKVISCDVEHENLSLSTEITISSQDSNLIDKELYCFTVGQIIPCRVASVHASGLHVEILPSGFHAFIPLCHLSDHPENCQFLLKTYRKGSVIDKAVCFSDGDPPIISCKPFLIDCIQNNRVFESFEQVKCGERVPVVVEKSAVDGMFVIMMNNLRAFVPLCEKFMNFYQHGQTLVGAAKNLEENSKLITMTVAPNDVAIPDDDDYNVLFLKTYLVEQKNIRQLFLRMNDVLRVRLASMKLGDKVDFVATVKTAEGFVGKTSLGVRGFLRSRQLSNRSSIKIGSTLKTMVLVVNYVDELVELTTEEYINISYLPSSMLTVGKEYMGTCILINEKYCIDALEVENQIAFAFRPAKLSPNEIGTREDLPPVGRKLCVLVKSVSEDFAIVALHARSVTDGMAM